MADKEVTLRLRFATDMPPMPAQGYGPGTPANSNQDWYAADTVGMGLNPGKFTPKRWGNMAQAAADFALSRGRVTDEGWGTNHPASDLTHHMFTGQGRYQASIPGTAAYQAVQSYNAENKKDSQDRRDHAAKQIDDFAGKLQTAATSLAYLTGASGGLTQAMNRAGGVFAAFQGVSSVLGMGGTSIGGIAAGVFGGGSGGSPFSTHTPNYGGGAAFGGGGAGSDGGFSAMHVAGGIAGGLAGRSAFQTIGNAAVRSILSVSGGVAGMGATALAGLGMVGYGVYSGRADGNQYELIRRLGERRAQFFGGGRVGDMGNWISQDTDQRGILNTMALKTSSFLSGGSLEASRLAHIQDVNAYQRSQSMLHSQYSSYGGYAGISLATSGVYAKRLGEAPQSQLELMKRVYGNDYQAQGELALQMQGIEAQSRHLGSRNSQIDVEQRHNTNERNFVRSQLTQAEGIFGKNVEKYGAESGQALEAKKMVVSLQKELNALEAEGVAIQGRAMGLEREVLAAKREQHVATAARLQSIVNIEQAGQDQSKLQYGRLDPGQRQYVKGVLARYDKGGRQAVAPDEMGIVEQYRRREAERDFREIADKEGFTDKGTMRDKVIGDATTELEKQKQLVIDISKQIEVKMELDNKQLAEELDKKLVPTFKNIIITINDIATKLQQVQEGMLHMQNAQKSQ